MTIRRRLNLAVTTLILIFLVTSGFALRAVRENTTMENSFSRMRDLSDLTSSINSGMYRQVATRRGLDISPREEGRAGWLSYALREIDMQVRLCNNDAERQLWSNLHRGVSALEENHSPTTEHLSLEEAIGMAEQSIHALRSMYRLAEYESITKSAERGERAQQVIWMAGSLILFLFLMYVIMVRDRLVRPIELLKQSAAAIGSGDLQHKVPLSGNDELAQLARRLEMMAQRLAEQQDALLKSRELSTIGKLCTSVADGLRNPLSIIRTKARAGNVRDFTTDQLAATVQEVRRQADRMDERITKLVEFSHPHELEKQPGTFRQIALTVQAHVRPLLQTHCLELVVEDDSDGAVWEVDRDALAEAIAELVVNAARKSAPSGQVEIACGLTEPTEEVDRRICISVRDSGSGMTPAEVNRAFDLFYTSRPNGTGMGLAIVRRTVERHGGDITIKSTMGKGTTVIITLPM